MDEKELFATLKRLQEPQGYLFNRDRDKVYALLKGLLVNRERYGNMVCPCRLAMEEKEADKDIICPCDYREADVQEYGSCYCGLYVSSDWNEGVVEHQYVPERRPVEKC